MQTLLLSAGRAVISSPVVVVRSRPALSLNTATNVDFCSPNSLSSLKTLQSSSYGALVSRGSKYCVTELSSAPVSPTFTSPNDESEKAKLAQVAKRLENTSRYFKRLGGLGFWGQLVCTVVAAVILSFSVVVTGKITSPATFYSTAAGIAAAFISVFWSFGYIRLSEKLRKTATDPSKAPPRADVVKSLKNGIVVNILGMGAAILGMQATVGLLVAKALTSTANPYYQGIAPGYSPVLALDVFLVQSLTKLLLRESRSSFGGISKHYPLSFSGACFLIGAVAFRDATTFRKQSSSKARLNS
ncbi:protein TIC 21, chloroplastic-like [Melia azedarach]|uniref:Protein TIC 21, chloroplastic-like n=1 Tax=Melia azedarach TaxID=155640 RepID=A0ACC1XYB3_MELAZ|nr:protein TIC 21, chloroplastic-like [Melia azedarach]